MTVRGRWLVVLALMAVVLAACGGGDDEATERASGGSADGGGGGDLVLWTTENQPERVTATEEMLAAFTDASGINVSLTAVEEDELPGLMVSNAASGDLPDVVYHPLDFSAGWAEEGLLDVEAANAALDELGRDTFSQGALDLAAFEEGVSAVPSDGWGQVLVYRTDLFEEEGLDPPESYDAIRAAAEALHDPGNDIFGITASTDPSAVFTQQTFEHVALANGCQLVDDGGAVTLSSPNCVGAIEFYADLINNFSPGGTQDVDSTRATYFAGQAGMVLWSPFILDEMAGLRDDALPTCDQCGDNAAYLAENSGFVSAFSGPDGEPSQYGQISLLGITVDAETEAAQELVKFWFDEGYTDWLAVSPEGKFPMRAGTTDDPEQFITAWKDLDTGVDSKAPLSDFYGGEVIETLITGTEDFSRWGFGQGQGQLISGLYESLEVPQVLSDVLSGGLDPQAAADELQAAAEDQQ